MVVNLSLLARHGLLKAADKLVNSKNMSALGDTWAAWKKQVELDLTHAKIDPIMPPKTKPAPRKLGGPGKNLPIDEFDDTHIYSGASKGRAEAAKVEVPPKEMGDSTKIPRTGPEWDEYFRTKYGDKNVTGKLVLSTNYLVINIFLIHLKLDQML